MKPFLILSAFLVAACSQAELETKAAEPAPKLAIEKPAPTTLKRQDLGGGFHMLSGRGGNILINIGSDGVYIVDDQFAHVSQEIIDFVKSNTDTPITYVLNTHHHGDHTGGNAEMKAVGATVVAHENVRARMGVSYLNQAFGRQQDARPAALWPTLTFTDQMTLWFNGDEIRAIHMPAGHTDGDTLVHFTGANIIHLGDNYFNATLPFVDVDSGGNIQGMIKAQQTAYDLSDNGTKIIPGHGKLSNKAELEVSIKRLQAIQDRIKARMDAGETLEAIIAADPLEDMTKLEGFMNKPKVITATWRSLGGKI